MDPEDNHPPIEVTDDGNPICINKPLCKTFDSIEMTDDSISI